MADIELEGFYEYEELLKNMTLSPELKKKAVRTGIKIIADKLEKDTPQGPTGELAEIKVKVKDLGLYVEGTASSKAFYDIFQNFGTSEQKANVGYFDKSVDDSESEALEQVAKVIFNKMR